MSKNKFQVINSVAKKLSSIEKFLLNFPVKAHKEEFNALYDEVDRVEVDYMKIDRLAVDDEYDVLLEELAEIRESIYGRLDLLETLLDAHRELLLDVGQAVTQIRETVAVVESTFREFQCDLKRFAKL